MNARQYLAVPYAQKDLAKALGARWDADAKLWYAESNFERFERWADPEKVAKLARYKADLQAGIIPKPQLPPHKQPKKKWASQKAARREAYQAKMREGFPTERTDLSLPDCGCVDVAPWEDCEHTAAGLFTGLTEEGQEHMRAIAAGA